MVFELVFITFFIFLVTKWYHSLEKVAFLRTSDQCLSSGPQEELQRVHGNVFSCTKRLSRSRTRRKRSAVKKLLPMTSLCLLNDLSEHVGHSFSFPPRAVWTGAPAKTVLEAPNRRGWCRQINNRWCPNIFSVCGQQMSNGDVLLLDSCWSADCFSYFQKNENSQHKCKFKISVGLKQISVLIS